MQRAGRKRVWQERVHDLDLLSIWTLCHKGPSQDLGKLLRQSSRVPESEGLAQNKDPPNILRPASASRPSEPQKQIVWGVLRAETRPTVPHSDHVGGWGRRLVFWSPDPPPPQ